MEFNEQVEISSEITLQKHILNTFLWMFAGLALTFAVAVVINFNPELQMQILMSDFLWYGCIIAQFGAVIVFSMGLQKMSVTFARACFFVYAVLTGVTFSVIGLVYTGETIALAFGCAAIYFGSLVIIGYTTKMNLSGIGTICISALIAMIVYSIIARVFNFGMDMFLYSFIGLIVFAGLTAWDVQKMKKLYTAHEGDNATLKKLSIYSAFDLYLDFINIFLYILRLLGNKRN